MCTGKGLSSSAAPAAACVVSKKIAEFYATRRWAATSTFSGHPLAVAAIAANIELILADKVLEHVRDVGGYLADRLADLAARHPSVAGASGIGLGYGINLVHPTSGEPWVPQDRWITHRRWTVSLPSIPAPTWPIGARNAGSCCSTSCPTR